MPLTLQCFIGKVGARRIVLATFFKCKGSPGAAGAGAAFAACSEEGLLDWQQSGLCQKKIQFAFPLISLCFPSAIFVAIYT